MSDVRSYLGVPPLAVFANGTGTPIVIDSLTGIAYYHYQNRVLPLFPGKVNAAYGGLRFQGAQAIALGTGWTRIANYNYEVFVPPIRMLVNAAAGTIEVLYAGEYQLSLSISMVFDESNAGRSYFARLARATDNTPATDAQEIFVGRNAGGSSIGNTLVFHLDFDQGPLVLEIGGGDVFTNVVLRSCRYSVNSIG